MNRMLTWEELDQQLQALCDRYVELCRENLPSAADLDAVAEEQRIREATGA